MWQFITNSRPSCFEFDSTEWDVMWPIAVSAKICEQELYFSGECFKHLHTAGCPWAYSWMWNEVLRSVSTTPATPVCWIS